MEKTHKIFDNQKDIQFWVDFSQNKMSLKDLARKYECTEHYADQRVTFIKQLNSPV